MIEQFHFLRPGWLLALLPVIGLAWLWLKHQAGVGQWRQVVDPKLLPHLISRMNITASNWPLRIATLVAVLIIIALAGPVWDRLPQPLFKQQAALVIALDLSKSMDVADLKPSRLLRVQHKIVDLLESRKEGQTGLIAFAADAFVVTPLSDDIETLKALLPSLTTNIMPVQGSRAHRAIALAIQLQQNAGVKHGDILLISDGIDADEAAKIEQLLAESKTYRLSILAAGTEQGGPIPIAQGGFFKDAQGSIVIAALQQQLLQQLAYGSEGSYQLISVDDGDIQRLSAAMETPMFSDDSEVVDTQADIWSENGPWLILLVLPLAALVFRRGILLTLPLMLLILPVDGDAIDWGTAWKNNNQRGEQLFKQGKHLESVELFDNLDWKASALYQSGEYQQALDLWQAQSAEGSEYNRANAMAKLGQLEKALQAYDKLLENNPANEDAKYNRKLVEDALKKQQPESSQQQNQQGEEGSQDQQKSDSSPSQQDSSSSDSEADSSSSSDSDSSAEEESSAQASNESEMDSAESQQEQAQAGQQQDDASAAEQESEQPAELTSEELDQQMSEQALEQWLRKIPDDPGGLLRRKFKYQYGQRKATEDNLNPW